MKFRLLLWPEDKRLEQLIRLDFIKIFSGATPLAGNKDKRGYIKSCLSSLIIHNLIHVSTKLLILSKGKIQSASFSGINQDYILIF